MLLLLGILIFVIFWWCGVYVYRESSFYACNFTDLLSLNKLELWFERQLLAGILDTDGHLNSTGTTTASITIPQNGTSQTVNVLSNTDWTFE